MAGKAHLESTYQAKVLRDLDSYQKYMESFKVESSSDNGFPDLFFTTTLTGAVFVEKKKKGEKARKLQKHKIDRLNKCGVKAFVSDSWEEWVVIKKSLGMTKEAVREHYNKTHGVISDKNL
jgi:hypothetical protein